MWNLESFTHQLGDAFEKVRKEVEAFGVVEEELTSDEAPASVQSDHHQQPTVIHVRNTRDKVAVDPVPSNASPVTLKLDVDEAESHCRVTLLAFKEEESKAESPQSPNSATSKLLKIREHQLQEQSQKLLQLQERNEVLERSALAVSKEEYEMRCRSYEERLKVAEHKIYSLTKERDNLLQTSTNHLEKDQIITEKDEMIEEIMAEGQRLSKKQLDLESAIRKKGSRIKELESENEGLKSKLKTELSNSEKLTAEKVQLNQTIEELDSDYKSQISNLKSEFEDCLRESSAAKAQAESEVQQIAREGLLQRAIEAETKSSSFSTYIDELESQLEDQKWNSEALEAKYKKELANLEEKCHEAEIRYEELSTKFPQATQPLLQQLEALQLDLDSKTEDWTLVEKSLLEQLDFLNRELQSTQQKEQNLQKKLELANEQTQHLTRRLEDSSKEAKTSLDQIQSLKTELEQSRIHGKDLERNFENFESEMTDWKSDQYQLQERLQSDLSNEKTAKLSLEMKLKHLQIEHQKQIADLEDQIKQQSHQQQRQEEEERHENSNFRRQRSIDEISIVSETTNSVELTSSKSLQLTRNHQIERLNKQIRTLENTRDHLSSELVVISQRALKAELNLADFEKMKGELIELQSRYDSAIELLGEREEHVEELKADLEDFKQMYRDQITYVAEQLSSKS